MKVIRIDHVAEEEAVSFLQSNSTFLDDGDYNLVTDNEGVTITIPSESYNYVYYFKNKKTGIIEKSEPSEWGLQRMPLYDSYK